MYIVKSLTKSLVAPHPDKGSGGNSFHPDLQELQGRRSSHGEFGLDMRKDFLARNV